MGDPAVSADTDELRITFDQTMDPGGRSIVGGGASFPEITGPPRWEDEGRTIVVPIKLRAGQGYWLSVNSDLFQNFTNAAGEPAQPWVVQFGVPGEVEFAEAPDPVHDRAVDALIEALERRYSYRDRLGIDWREAIEPHRDQLARSKDADTLARTASVILARAQDKHVWLSVGETRYASYQRPLNPNANPQLRAQLVPGYRQLNDTVGVGRFEDGVGYVAIDSWDATRTDDIEQALEALDRFRDWPGLVIDVRLNGGGDETLAQRVAGCFIENAQIYAQQQVVDGKGGLGDRGLRVARPNTDWQESYGPFRGRVAVLSGPVVMSSCEAFVLMIKQAPNAAVIGSRTQGSSGNPKPHELGNGVVIYLPSWRAMTAEGVPFEGVGVTPDIAVRAPVQVFRTADPVLERALEWVRSEE